MLSLESITILQGWITLGLTLFGITVAFFQLSLSNYYRLLNLIESAATNFNSKISNANSLDKCDACREAIIEFDAIVRYELKKTFFANIFLYGNTNNNILLKLRLHFLAKCKVDLRVFLSPYDMFAYYFMPELTDNAINVNLDFNEIENKYVYKLREINDKYFESSDKDKMQTFNDERNELIKLYTCVKSSKLNYEIWKEAIISYDKLINYPSILI